MEDVSFDILPFVSFLILRFIIGCVYFTIAIKYCLFISLLIEQNYFSKNYFYTIWKKLQRVTKK